MSMSKQIMSMSKQERKEKLINFLKKDQYFRNINFVVSKGRLDILIFYHKIGCN
jgi:hypothetical protein